MEAQQPHLPVTQYTKRAQRDGLPRRLGFSSIEQVAKNKNKIVNEQKKAMKDLKEQKLGSNRPYRQARRESIGKNLVGRKLKIDKSWNKEQEKPKKKKPVKKVPAKSLDDLDKEMDSYFSSDKQEK